MKKNVLMYLVFLGCVFWAAYVGGQFTQAVGSVWYKNLAQPDFSPPDWVFGPVWTFLYISMSVAGWLVWKNKGFSGASLSLGFFFFQLILNAMWSYLFFGLQNPGRAFVEILVLGAAILVTTAGFFKHSVWAGILMVPYFLWVSFAAVLNYSIWQMN